MPAKATESDILAWIEGELPPERADAVEAAFGEDPSLRAWAASMRGDRAMLRSWSERAVSSAPGGLAESALEIVEREALLGPSVREALAFEHEPEPERESVTMVFRIRRYATAAAIVLLVGVIGVTGVRLGSRSGWFGGEMAVKAPAGGDLAMLPDEAMDETPSDPRSDLLEAVHRAGRSAGEANGGLAGGLASVDDDPALEPAPEADLMAEEDALKLALAAPASPDEFGAMSGPGASREYPIRPLSKQTTLSALVEELLGKVAIDGGPAIAITPEQASGPDVRDRVVVRAWSADPDEVVASMRTLSGAQGSPAVGWHVVSGRPEDVSPVDGMVCTVSLPGEAAGFAWFVEALHQAGASRVELTLRDGSAPGAAKTGLTDAAGALWWGEPIRVWAGWTRVPVLISPAESAEPGSVIDQADRADPVKTPE